MEKAIRSIISFLDGFVQYGLGFRRTEPSTPSKPIQLVAAEGLGSEARRLLEALAEAWWDDELLDEPLEVAIRTRRPAAIIELYHALAAQVTHDERAYAANHCIASIASALPFLPGEGGVAAAIAAAGFCPRFEHWPRVAATIPFAWAFHVGARLGAGQNGDTLEAAVSFHAGDTRAWDLLAAWIQEHLMRGGDPARSASVRRFWDQLREAKHPIAWLPLTRTAVEQPIAFTAPAFERGSRINGRKSKMQAARYTRGRWTARASDMVRRELPRDAPDANSDVSHAPYRSAATAEAVVLREDVELVSRLCDPIVYWWSKHGVLCGFDRCVGANELRTPMLKHVPYAKSARSIEQMSAADTTATLFEVAARAYFVESGARGRLAALRSLSALVGAPPDEPIEGIVAMAADATFLRAHSYVDLVVMALRPDGTLAVVAGTETDD